MIEELDQRSREIFREIVETFFETGDPVGSRTLSRRLPVKLSPASIRNVMADLEDLGLLYAPHTSAGRLPTERGVRLFVDGLLQIGELNSEERDRIESQCAGNGRSLTEVPHQATDMLSGLSRATGLVLAPKSEAPVKHVEFVPLSPGKALAIMVVVTGLVENRLIELPQGFTPAALTEAANYLNARLSGRTLTEAHASVSAELEAHTAQLDALATKVVEAGIATWSGDGDESMLILRGRDKMFEDVNAVADLERIRALFESLERKNSLLRLIDSTQGGEGVHVFIGAESRLFDLAGCSMIVAPLAGANRDDGAAKPVGAIGVIGPTRINYARIIPMVDYTARAVSRLMG